MVKEKEKICYQLTSKVPFEDPDFEPEELTYKLGIKKSSITDFLVDTEFGKILNVDYRRDNIEDVIFDTDEIYELDFGSHYIDLFEGVFLMNYRPSEEELKKIQEGIFNLVHMIQVQMIRDERKEYNDMIFNETECVVFSLEKIDISEYYKPIETIFQYRYTPKFGVIEKREVEESDNKVSDDLPF